MHLGLVLTRRTESLPDEGDRIETEAVDAAVGEEESDVGELVHDIGVGPVEVPLVVVERRPHPRVEAVVPREVARGEVGEHLRQRLLIGVGDGAVGVDVEVVAVLRIPSPGSLGPRMLGRDVVEHEVDGQSDAIEVEHLSEALEVRHRAQVCAHLAIVGDGVAAVVGRGPWFEQRHQVEVGGPELAQVVDVLRHTFERAGEPIRVRDVPERVGSLEPVGHEQTVAIAIPQVLRALRPVHDHEIGEPVEQVVSLLDEHGAYAGLELAAPPPRPREQVVGTGGALEAAPAYCDGHPIRDVRCKRCHGDIVRYCPAFRERGTPICNRSHLDGPGTGTAYSLSSASDCYLTAAGLTADARLRRVGASSEGSKTMATRTTGDILDEGVSLPMHRRPARHKAAFIEMLVSSILSLSASLVLSVDAIALAKNPAAELSCNFTKHISCSTVGLSWQASLLGFPNAFLGLIAEPVVITLAIAALLGVVFPRGFMISAQVIYTIGLLFAYWLFYEAYFVIGALCPWCLVVTVTTTLVFASMTRVNLLDGNLRLPGSLHAKALRGLHLGVDHATVMLVFAVMAAMIIKNYL